MQKSRPSGRLFSFCGVRYRRRRCRQRARPLAVASRALPLPRVTDTAALLLAPLGSAVLGSATWSNRLNVLRLGSVIVRTRVMSSAPPGASGAAWLQVTACPLDVHPNPPPVPDARTTPAGR